ETLASVAADSTKTPAERRQWSRVYSYLNQFMTSLDSTRAMEAADSVSAAGVAGVVRATAPRTEAGPNIHVRDIVESDNGPRSAFEVTFPSAIMWALIGVCMSFAISIVDERIRGTFLRLRLAPIPHRSILVGKALAAFLAAIATTGLLLAI